MAEPGERGRFIARPVYLALGVMLAMLLFPKHIAYASIGIVAVGDPVAAYVGGKFGRRHIRRNKTLEGSMAGLVLSFILASLMVSPISALVGAPAAMLMELLDFPDDNLTMPIAAGAMMLLAAPL